MTRAAAARDLVAAIDRFLEADARRRKARATGPLERRVQREVARAFRLQGRAFLRRLAAIQARFAVEEARRSARKLAEALREEDWHPIFDAAVLETLEAFDTALRPYVRAALLEGARSTIAELSLRSSFDLANPAAVAYLEDHLAERVAGINDTTRQAVGRIIAKGVEQRLSYSAIARQLKAQYEIFAVGSPLQHIASRAELIAVTEIGDAYEAGSRQVADRLALVGLTMEKSWLEVGDDRVDETCAANAAQEWIPIDQAFGSGHQQPTAHPGCRCTCLYRRTPD